MYTRNYYDSDSNMPSGYDGVAIRMDERESPKNEEITEVFNERKDTVEKTGTVDGILSGLFGKLHLGLPSLEKIGYEEILIIGVAIFLLFSADGDKECALLLILLLLIN